MYHWFGVDFISCQRHLSVVMLFLCLAHLPAFQFDVYLQSVFGILGRTLKVLCSLYRTQKTVIGFCFGKVFHYFVVCISGVNF